MRKHQALRFPLLDGVHTLTDAMNLRDLVVGHTERRGENPFFLNLDASCWRR